MAYEKLQAYTGIEVIPSDSINIPFPGEVISGAATATTSDKLVNSAGLFISQGVGIGDIIYNDTDGTVCTVTAVDSETELSVSADIFASAETYRVFKANLNNGCALYVGGDGDLKVTTVGKTDLTFIGLTAGQFIPVQIVRVWSTGTTATNIIGLW
jgi:hypothetical protein